MSRNIKLTRQEKAIETALLKGEYAPVDAKTFKDVAHAVASRKKDAVLNLRINRADLASLKEKANALGVRYQTFIAELLHRYAHGS